MTALRFGFPTPLLCFLTTWLMVGQKTGAFQLMFFISIDSRFVALCGLPVSSFFFLSAETIRFLGREEAATFDRVVISGSGVDAS